MASCTGVTINPGDMQNSYYNCNPPQHAEKAYQPNQGDQAPPVSTVPTTLGPNGIAVILDTTLRNLNTGAQSQVQLVDFDGLCKYNGGTCPADPLKAQQILNQHPDLIITTATGRTPFIAVVAAQPNSRVTVRPMTGGTQAKALSKTDYTNCGCQPAI
ncbi:MAG TPA: hypothetical protein VF538_10345 [Pyrinomonadaceae bacterium]|jgi:hypothetical protein